MEAALARPAIAHCVGSYLYVDEAVRLLRCSTTLYRAPSSRPGSRALVKSALHHGGCSAASRTRCVH